MSDSGEVVLRARICSVRDRDAEFDTAVATQAQPGLSQQTVENLLVEAFDAMVERLPTGEYDVKTAATYRRAERIRDAVSGVWWKVTVMLQPEVRATCAYGLKMQK